MKKSVGLLLSAAMFCSGFSGLAGCGTHTTGSGGGVSIDPSKEVISISLFSAGFGTQWLDDLLNDYNATLTGNYQFNRIPENTNSIDTITDQLEAGIRSADIYFNDTNASRPDVRLGVKAGRNGNDRARQDPRQRRL